MAALFKKYKLEINTEKHNPKSWYLHEIIVNLNEDLMCLYHFLSSLILMLLQDSRIFCHFVDQLFFSTFNLQYLWLIYIEIYSY